MERHAIDVPGDGTFRVVEHPDGETDCDAPKALSSPPPEEGVWWTWLDPHGARSWELVQ